MKDFREVISKEIKGRFSERIPAVICKGMHEVILEEIKRILEKILEECLEESLKQTLK